VRVGRGPLPAPLLPEALPGVPLGRRFGGHRGPEPTMAELDALVAEQMKNLPDWWHSASED